jgi:hypothetical protein
MILAAIAASALLGGIELACADPADTKPNDPNATADSPQLDKNEVICKRGEVTTGSRFPGPPICHTRMEWEQLRRDAQQLVNQMNGGSSGPH